MKTIFLFIGIFAAIGVFLLFLDIYFSQEQKEKRREKRESKNN